MRLHLIELLDLQSSPTVLPLSLSHHVETGRPHQKYIVTRTRVSRSKSPDQQTHFCVVLAPAIRFWWTIRALPPSPQHLSVKALNYNSVLRHATFEPTSTKPFYYIILFFFCQDVMFFYIVIYPKFFCNMSSFTTHPAFWNCIAH